MNFLPFVFTFLLLLTLVSSFLFSSVMGSVRENKLILAQREAYLSLLTEQNKALFQKQVLKTKSETPTDPAKKQEKEDEDDGLDETKAPRSLLDGCEKSKLNLTMLLHGNDPTTSKLVEKTAIHLIEVLYGSCDFYKKGIAQAIVKQMIKDKIETFEELKLKSPEHNAIYYKMLQGTSTSYPALTEYFSLSKSSPRPIYFRYASKPVLRAALGETFATTLFDMERKRWEKNHHCKVLLKEDFLDLAKTKYGMDNATALALIDFDMKNKGAIQTLTDASGTIRAVHPINQANQ